MKFLAIIQARIGSSRLPGKVLLDLGGKPVLQQVIARVRQSRQLDEIVVATSIAEENLPIERLCASIGAPVFSGSEDDVLDRYYQAAKRYQPEYIVRITADCPCYDAQLLDRAIASLHPDTDYMGDFDETLPDGLDLEIFTFSALKMTWEDAALASEREHVTQYMRKNPQLFRHQNITCPVPGIGHLRLTLDEVEDYRLLRKIYEHFESCQATFSMQDVLDFLEANPGLSSLNSQHTRNEGLAKSLAADRLARQEVEIRGALY